MTLPFEVAEAALKINWENLKTIFPESFQLGPDYTSRAGPVSRAGSLCRDLRMSVKRNKTQLRDYMTTGPARLAEIPVSRCRDLG